MVLHFKLNYKAYVNSLSCPFNLDYHNRYHKTKRNVFDYFADFFGIDIESAITNNQVNDISFPTFEEALGILDLAISKNERYKTCGSELQNIRTSLVFSMAAAIQYQLDFT